MSRPRDGVTLGQWMIVILVGSLVLGLCVAVDKALHPDGPYDFPPGPLPQTGIPAGGRIGYGDK